MYFNSKQDINFLKYIITYVPVDQHKEKITTRKKSINSMIFIF